MDPSAEMLAEAREMVPANVRLVRGSSYDLSRDIGPVRLVTMGRSFHWMDRADTLRRLDGIVGTGGAVGLFGDDHPDLPENGWEREYRALLKRWSDLDHSRVRWREGWVRHEAFLLDSAFCQLERIAVIERRRTPGEALIDRALSLSSTSREKLGDRADELVAELRAWLAGAAPDGFVSEVVSTSALLAFRE